MSRFLEYGVFVPSGEKAKDTVASSAAAQPAFKWAKVGAKWCKVGADGQPIDVSPPTAAPSSPSSSTSRGLSGESSSSSSGAGGAGGDDAASDDNAEIQDGMGGPRSNGGGGSLFGANGNGVGGAGRRSMDNDDAGDGDDNSSVDDGSARDAQQRPRSRSKSSSVAPSSEADTLPRQDGLPPGGPGGGLEGVRGGRVEGEGGEDTRSEISGSARTGSRPNSEQLMLTPGMTRAYNKEGAVDNFFGEGDHCRGRSGERDELGAEDRGAFCSSSDVACVGERAVEGGAAGGSDGGEERHKRTGSGSSNTANSPVPKKDGSEKLLVETRDVACQWDGSEYCIISTNKAKLPWHNCTCTCICPVIELCATDSFVVLGMIPVTCFPCWP